MTFIQLLKKDATVRNAFVFSIVIFIIFAVLCIFGFSRYYSIYYDQRREDAINGIEPIISEYSDKLNLFGARFFDADGTVSNEDFNNFASILIADDESIDHIYFSPNGDVTHVYPENDSLIGTEIVNNFSLEEFSRFSNSILEDTYFLTYDYQNEILTKVHFNKAIVVNEEFTGLVTIVVDVDQFVELLPDFEEDNEITIATKEFVFLKSSPIYDEDSFRNSDISIHGVEFTIATHYYGDYYLRTIAMVVLAMFALTMPLLIIFMTFLEDQRKTKSFLYEIEYTRNFSTETGLKNAKSLYEDAEKLLSTKNEFYLALGVFNNIKYINDKFGHILGDKLILEAVTLITGVLRNNIQLYHFGGNEYVFVINTERKGEVSNILNRVLKVFDRDIVIDNIRTNISMTIGVVSYPTQGKTIDELIKNAHLTLSSSRIINTNAFAFYKKDSVNTLIENSDLDKYVKNLNLELCEVYLMPIVNVETNIIAGFECLTRVFNEFDEAMDTETIVNSLERNGRIQELDEIVFKKMIRIMRRINIEFPDNEYFLSVNASALSLNDNYVNNIIELYEKEHFSKGTIVLELTESYQVEDNNYIIRLFDRLNSIGIKTAIDDFGSGYSSLSYISKFPVYAIKVDKEYVRDYLTNSFNRTLLMTLNSIAEVLDCKLVAEGVDDPETLDYLKANGCQFYQGFLFSKGVTFEESIKMIKKNRKEYAK